MLQDVRYALRSLVRDRRFAAAVVLMLALAGGADLAVFSLVHAILIAPLPYRDPGALVLVFETNPSKGIGRSTMSDGRFLDLRTDVHGFEALGGFAPQPRDTIVQFDRDPEVVRQAQTTADFMDVLGVPPQRGSAAEARLSFNYWQRRFGADPSAVGRRIIFEGFAQSPREIGGVMPAGFDLPSGTDLWGAGLQPSHERTFRWLSVIGRLKPGVSASQAQSELDSASRRLGAEYPDTDEGWRDVVVPLKDTIVAPARTPLVLLYLSVSLLLLIAALNVALLVTARRLRRGRDVAIHLALGAGRARVLRQMGVQCLALSAAAMAGGVLLASALVRVLLAMSPSSIPRLSEVRFGARDVGAGAGLAVLIGLLMWGLSCVGSRVSLDALRVSGRASAATPRARALRSILVQVEVACCACLLLVASGAVRTFVQLERAPLGFDPHGVLLVDVRQPIMKAGEHVRHYPTQRFVRTAERVRNYAAALPGVASAAIATAVPLAAPASPTVYRWVDHSLTGPLPDHDSVEVKGRDAKQSLQRVVGADFFRTSGISILAGRSFQPSDRLDDRQIDDFDADRGAGAVIVNAAFARQAGSIPSVVGRYLSVNGAMYRSFQIVGVAADVVSTPGAAPEPLMYLPYAQDPRDQFTLMVRAASPDAVSKPLADYLRGSLGTDVSAFNTRTYDDVVDTALAAPRFSGRVMSVFGAAAAAFTAVALYSVLTFLVVLRRREFAIRIALGAEPASLVTGVLRQGLALTMVGVAVGVVAGAILIRGLAAALPGIHASTPLDAAVTGCILAIAAGAASYRPAAAAARVDPLPLLKAE
jgi:putative ABC transport system permease protein